MILDTLWKELEEEAQRITGTGILKRMLMPDTFCTMFAGVHHPSYNRLFMLQAPQNLLPSKDQIPESQGFELTVQITGEETDAHVTFVLSATSKIYNEIFSAMVEDLCQCLQKCQEDRQIVKIFLERLLQWQQFFERNGVDGLSEEAQRGLYGELYFLKNYLLSESQYFSEEISGWTGSKNRQHDFQFTNTAIEVKTSSAKQHQKLFISSEQQLDETLVGNLFIFYLSLSLLDSHTDTLPKLINELQSLLCENYAAVSAFEVALLTRGYLHAQAWRYQKTGYTVRGHNVFRVTAGFPRLTERDLPIGVGDLSYSISVAACEKFEAPMSELISHIRGGRV